MLLWSADFQDNFYSQVDKSTGVGSNSKGTINLGEYLAMVKAGGLCDKLVSHHDRDYNHLRQSQHGRCLVRSRGGGRRPNGGTELDLNEFWEVVCRISVEKNPDSLEDFEDTLDSS